MHTTAPAFAAATPAGRAGCGSRCKWLLAVVVLLSWAAQARAQTPCEASDHGMVADGSDNSAALTRTLTECAGQVIHIAHGTYIFSPQGFAVGFRVPANTVLQGDGGQGEQATILRVADGGTYQGFLWVRNASNVTIRGLRLEGSRYDSGCARHLDYGHAVYIESDPNESQRVENVVVSDDTFYNFNGLSWVTLNAGERSAGISGVTVSNNLFDSDANLSGGCAALGMVYTAAMISVHGANLSAQGLVTNVLVSSNTMHGGYVKEGVAMWSGTSGISVKHNAIDDIGLHLPRTPGAELGRYAVVVYNSAYDNPGLHPDTIWITDNVISNPVSCGVYVAGGRNLQISGNRISGQLDRNDGTLLKGAIALNHADNVFSLENNDLIGNYIGISSIGSTMNMGSNRIVAAPGGRATKLY